MNNVLTIGGATQDIFICHKNAHMIHLETAEGARAFLALQEGKKIEINSLDYHTGGGATNSATSFSRLGFPTACCIKIGDDDQGHHIIHELAIENVIVHAAIDKKIATGTSFILPTEHKDRVVLVWRGANTQLQEHNIPEQVILDTDCLYITSLSGPASHTFLPITQRAKKLGKKVATNPGTSQLTIGANTLINALGNVDILIMNGYEAHLCMKTLIQQNKIERQQMPQKKHSNAPELLINPRMYEKNYYDIRVFFKTILTLGPDIVVVTNGKEGVYVATQHTLLFHPSLPTQIINTLGAGDAFGSCFVASILKDNDIKKATLCGLLNAQSVIEHLDAKSGLLDSQELEKRYQTLNPQKNTLFKKFNIE